MNLSHLLTIIIIIIDNHITNEALNTYWISWKETCIKVSNKHVPCKNTRVKNRTSKWINRTIIKKINKRDHYHYKAIKSNDYAPKLSVATISTIEESNNS